MDKGSSEVTDPGVNLGLMQVGFGIVGRCGL